MELSEKLKSLIDEIEKLPSIGPKSAERIALYLLSETDAEVNQFIDTLTEARKNLHLCPICFNITDKDICEICSNEERDKTTVCVVEEISDLLAIEKTNTFRGQYHVLHGKIDPINHKGATNIYINELIERVRKGDIKEVILATDPNFTGDLTADYIAKLLKPFNIKVSRIAVGLPKEGEIVFTDSVTLSAAIRERKEYK
jgi:recombination protein RecR